MHCFVFIGESFSKMTLNAGGHTSDCVSGLLRQTCPLNFIAIVTSALGSEADLHALNNSAECSRTFKCLPKAHNTLQDEGSSLSPLIFLIWSVIPRRFANSMANSISCDMKDWIVVVTFALEITAGRVLWNGYLETKVAFLSDLRSANLASIRLRHGALVGSRVGSAWPVGVSPCSVRYRVLLKPEKSVSYLLALARSTAAPKIEAQ